MLVENKNKSVFLQTRSQRGSRFRGVSKNGTKWQVTIVRGELKKYIGAVESEEIAARLYDKYALIIKGFDVSEIIKCSGDFAVVDPKEILTSFYRYRPKPTSPTRAERLSNWSFLRTGNSIRCGPCICRWGEISRCSR